MGFWAWVWNRVKGEPGDFRAAASGRFGEHRTQLRATRELEGLFAQAALRAFSQYQARRESDSRVRPDGSRGRETWKEEGLKVSVTDGYSRDYDEYVTDIVVESLDPNFSGHLHIGFDDRGNELWRHWKDH